MTECKVGDIVSVEFPFSDFQTQKRRPGLVLVADNNDILLARLTTHPPRDAADVALWHWVDAGLPKPSTVRLTKLATIDCRLVHHRIGRLHPDDSKAIAQAWQQMTANMLIALCQPSI